MVTKQMSYCSLEEAWGTQYANLYKKDDTMLTAMPKQDGSVQDSDNLILKDRELTSISKPVEKNMLDKEMGDYYMNMKDELGEKNDMKECDKFLEHFLECSNCKRKIDKILDINNIPQKESFIESFKNMDDNYLDIFILILIGIFVIFVLDCFVRLGKNFRK